MKFYYCRYTVDLCMYCVYICALCINRLRTNFYPLRIYVLNFLHLLPQVTPYPSPPLSVPREGDLHGLHYQASLPSGFWMGLANGKYQQEMGGWIMGWW